jgi:hypothetical protein
MHVSDSGVGLDIQNSFNMSVFLDAFVSLPSRPSVCLRLYTWNGRTAKLIFFKIKFDTGEFEEKLFAISIFLHIGQFWRLLYMSTYLYFCLRESFRCYFANFQ